MSSNHPTCLNATCDRILPAVVLVLLAALVAPASAKDQDEKTLKQSNPAKVVGWEPIVADFYMLTSPNAPKLVEGALVPDFDADKNLVPKPKLDVLAPPAEIPDPPPLYIDWQQLVTRKEPCSLWLVSRTMRNYEGIPRLGIHRVGSSYSEAQNAPLPFVGYADGVGTDLYIRIDVPFEKMDFAAPAGTDRRKYIFENIKVVGKEVVFRYYNGVRREGEGGQSGQEDYRADEQLKSLTTLAAFLDPAKPVIVTYQPRGETRRNNDGTYDHVMGISFRFDLEAGPELGFNPAERKTLEGEARVAILSEATVRFYTLEESRRNR